jgi:hypothetical protein
LLALKAHTHSFVNSRSPRLPAVRSHVDRTQFGWIEIDG